MYDTDFPEYGRQAELVLPQKGGRYVVIVGQTDWGFIVEGRHGTHLSVSPDEIVIDEY